MHAGGGGGYYMKQPASIIVCKLSTGHNWVFLFVFCFVTVAFSLHLMNALSYLQVNLYALYCGWKILWTLFIKTLVYTEVPMQKFQFISSLVGNSASEQ